MNSPRSSRVPEFGRPDANEIVIGATTHKMAPVEPLDVNGVRTMAVGTALWAVALVGLLPFWSTLEETGRTWWVWTALAGVGIGLLGFEHCRSRAARTPLSVSSSSSEAAANLAARTSPKTPLPTSGTKSTPASPSERLSFRKPPPLSQLEDRALDENPAVDEAPSEPAAAVPAVPTSLDLAADSTVVASQDALGSPSSDPAREPRPVGRRRKPGPAE